MRTALVLVIRRDDNGHWEAPGGVLELQEPFEGGVRREVLEETGLEVTVERLTGVYKNLTHGIVALVYRCRPADGDAHPTAEAREVRWMTREEVQSAMNPAFAVRVLDALQDDVHSRAHDGMNLVSD
ncbi:MAG: NUDIX hydrolase [Actinomycetota bacterium]|uniref:NUDIX hydrolase n=1 Tax=Mycobacterium lentiflavum TaxID=141349 RepID=A0ABY3UY03_MYCLN|nr:NUDIX hydrolase [Mycobacterium lentiflavum]MEE3064950.1 NUDIX hydrolase [Actinomycetota bacterium]ULP41865.1 NUDIX hydrolase [Mycobacterium lentiflavum]